MKAYCIRGSKHRHGLEANAYKGELADEMGRQSRYDFFHVSLRCHIVESRTWMQIQ